MIKLTQSSDLLKRRLCSVRILYLAHPAFHEDNMPRKLVTMPPPSCQQRRIYHYRPLQSEYRFESAGQDGVNLFDAYIGRVDGLVGADDPMFENQGVKVTYKIKFQEMDYSKQKYARRSRGFITRRKAIQQVAQVALDFFRVQYGKDYPIDSLKPFYLLRLERAGVSLFHCIIAYDEACRPLYGPTLAPPTHIDTLEKIPQGDEHAYHTDSCCMGEAALFDTLPQSFPSDLIGSMGSNPEFPCAPYDVYNAILATTEGVVPSETSYLTSPHQVPNQPGGWSAGEPSSSLEDFARFLAQTVVLQYLMLQQQNHCEIAAVA